MTDPFERPRHRDRIPFYVGVSARGKGHGVGSKAPLPALLRRRPVRAFLLAAVRQRALQRERMGGVWVYHSSDPAVGDAQRRARQARTDERRASEAAAALAPTVIIEVLLIRHPGSSPVQVARRLQGHAPPIVLSQVSAVFIRFDLESRSGKRGALRAAEAVAGTGAGRPGDGIARARQCGAAFLPVDFPAEAR